MDTYDDEARSSLRQYLHTLWRRRVVVVAFVAVFVAVALAYGVATTKVYRGTADLLLTPQVSSALLQATNSVDSAVTIDVPTAIEVIQSSSLQQDVQKSIPSAPGVSASEVGTTSVVAISVDSTNPKLAARAANAYAEGYLHLQQKQATATIDGAILLLTERLNSIQSSIASAQGAAGGSPTFQIQGLQEEAVTLQNEITNDQLVAGESSADGQVVSAASVPTAPVKPKTLEYAVLAGLLGLVLGIGVAMLLEFFDDGVRTREDVARIVTNRPVLAMIPDVPDWRGGEARLVSRSEPSSDPAEAYRSLRTSIEFLSLDRSIRTLLVTSAGTAEGKTTTVANLAVVLAQAGRRVVAVCCDLRRPRLHEFFGMSNQVGFTSVLLGESSLQEALHGVAGLPNLYVLPAGAVPPNPSELLSGARTEELLETIAANADIVIIDSPPILPVTDASVLASRCDAVVVVAAVGVSTRNHLARAVEALEYIEAPISGVVLNRSASDGPSHYAQAPQRGLTVPAPMRLDRRNGHAAPRREEVGVR
jgi:capsular exopolysaccharide synthesis family protein